METHENSEAMPSRTERLESVYGEFLDALRNSSTLDDFSHIERDIMTKIGELQNEAAEVEEDFSIMFRNGFNFDEIRQGVKNYAEAYEDVKSIIDAMSENSKQRKIDAHEEQKNLIPDEVREQVERIVDETKKRNDEYWAE